MGKSTTSNLVHCFGKPHLPVRGILRRPDRAIDSPEEAADEGLRHSREVTWVCSRELIHRYAFGADDNAIHAKPKTLRIRVLRPRWVTLTEQKWVTIRERRGTGDGYYEAVVLDSEGNLVEITA